MDKGANPNPTNITIYHQNKELIHQELSSDSHWITFQATREDSNPYYHFIVKADSAFIPKLHDSGSTDERELSVRILDIKIRSNAR
jgi:hypothetical protein